MVHIRFAELWDAPHGQPYMIIVTTNAVSNGWGKMVMGAGSAAQAKEVYPALTEIAYKKIKERFPDYRLNGHNEDYGFLPIFEPPHGIGIFQTKRHWAEVARLDTIQSSVDSLTKYASLHLDVNFRLPFPGVGCGRLGEGVPPKDEEIKRLLVCLPDNVTVVHWH